MELLEKVLTNNNLEQAYKQVYANKGASGIDRVTVCKLKDYMNKHMKELKEENHSLKNTLEFWKDKFLRVMFLIKDKLFGKEKNEKNILMYQKTYIKRYY